MLSHRSLLCTSARSNAVTRITDGAADQPSDVPATTDLRIEQLLVRGAVVKRSSAIRCQADSSCAAAILFPD